MSIKNNDILDYRLQLKLLSINGQVQGMLKIVVALAGNQNWVNCLGSSYAHHYTTKTSVQKMINDTLQYK